MTVPTRSNKPELRGLLQDPTRPRGRTAPRANQEHEIQASDSKGCTSSDPGEGYVKGIGDGSGHTSIHLFGGYPSTPYHDRQPGAPSRARNILALREGEGGTPEEELLGATPNLRSLLTKAQESQKALQKIMPNDEIKAFVKGWNPWTKKKKFLPASPKEEQFGKHRSSTSINFENPHKWKKVLDMLKIAKGLYKNIN
ncbi:hypothetical protein PTTG_07004 [Puccinia triticina 1-1 BBBD Race 1]|uniref:Uncharacterized protein n=1 Tax=Puccinia triticina (isolate 1-1 / race 1 (BBBD)) TaxID=630390 RepID=A0A0C4F1N3_PUCT1|nr:hypothetical protein PTTG_07004 [Puccinia triticina 1-1 BBBD Race 1]